MFQFFKKKSLTLFRVGLLIFIFILSVFLSCEGGKMSDKKVSSDLIKGISESELRKLSEKKIYFGHQSVGFNLIEGVKDVSNENPQIKFKITENNNPDIFTEPLFAHSRVGKNEDPISKIKGFVEFMENGIGDRADFAFFKFCYIDIKAKTDIDKLFSYYKENMKRLKDKYPKTTFIHVTVPLTVVQTGLKAWIKKVIGKPVGGYADNMRRNEYNELLRKEYEGKEHIFDLAEVESTFPDGKRASFTDNGKIFFYLVPEYSRDGRHLNEKGRKIIAEKLIIFLADISE